MLTSLRSFGPHHFRLLLLGLTILVSWVLNGQAQASATLTLAWDPAPNAAGYRLHIGTTSRVYTQQINVGSATSTLVSNLISGKRYFFAVSAYNAAGLESALSNEVSYLTGAPTPSPSSTPTPTPAPSATPIRTPTPTPTPASTPTSSVQIIVQTSRAGLTFKVDGATYTSARTFSWKPGSSHTIATMSPQQGNSGVQYGWTSWNDGGSISHTITPTTNKTYTANFTTQYFLTMVSFVTTSDSAAGVGGTVSPVSGWQNSGSRIRITATPSTGSSFKGWSGTGTGSVSGTTNPVYITINGPINETATFTHK